jgi:AhpD family alkylhydroperoxidase
MTRMIPAPAERYEPLYGEAAPLVLRIYANQPKLAKAITSMTETVLFGGELSPRLVELVRLRIAFHNQCRSCMALRNSPGAEAGVDEDLICSLERPQDAEDLSADERAALAYADLMATNHLAIDDRTYSGLRQHFTEPEIVELGLICAVCVGTGRLAASWDMVDDLPEYFHMRDAIITPWGAGTALAE